MVPVSLDSQGSTILAYFIYTFYIHGFYFLYIYNCFLTIFCIGNNFLFVKKINNHLSTSVSSVWTVGLLSQLNSRLHSFIIVIWVSFIKLSLPTAISFLHSLLETCKLMQFIVNCNSNHFCITESNYRSQTELWNLWNY